MNDFYVIKNDELYHYGVKGMKWGVRKEYEPHPREKSSKVEEPSSEKKKKGLTDKQKKYLKIGVAVVGAALVAYGGYKIYSSYNDIGKKFDPETGFRLLDKELTDEQILNRINPGRIRFFSSFKNKEIISGSSTNCMLCTTDYELLKRGYDVRAGFDNSGRGFMPNELFPKLFKDYKGTTKIYQSIDAIDLDRNDQIHDIYENVIDNLKSQGSGSRGNIMVWWNRALGSGGHSMIWENVNGNIEFKDGQTGVIYKDFEKQILSNVNTFKPVEILRTDNLTLDIKGVKDHMNLHNLTKTYIYDGKEIVENMASEPVVQYSAYVLGLGGLTVMANRNAINNYKKEHPNTKLSDEEIWNLVKSK